MDSSTPVLDLIDELNNSTLVRHADTFNFSTLYTSIPHNLLLQCLEELITESFRVRGATYICVNHNNAFWSDNKVNNQEHNVSESNLIEYVRFLVDSIYIQVGDRVYKQKIGIPMGTDCAPHLANFYYEYKYIKDKLSNNHKVASLFRNTVRFIDDLLTFNNPMFEEEVYNIYPTELVLKKTTETPHRLSYLDIMILIINKKIVTSVYDKRDAFNFNIVNYPFLDGNISGRQSYGVYVSQLVRIGRICST